MEACSGGIGEAVVWQGWAAARRGAKTWGVKRKAHESNQSGCVATIVQAGQDRAWVAEGRRCLVISITEVVTVFSTMI